MTTRLQLTEWSTTPGVRLTPPQRDLLRTVFTATVQPSPGTNDLFDVTPGNIIGAGTVDGLAIVIRPKIPISRVLFLLGYATDPDHWRDGEAAIDDHVDVVDVVDAVATLYLRTIRRTIGRGLLAGYHEVRDTQPTVRGRIDLAEQLKRRPGLSAPLALEYCQHDHDIPENQLLLSAALLLARLPLRDTATRRELRRLTDSFPDVTPLQPHRSRIPSITWTRLNGYYRPAVELARLLLSGASPELGAGNASTDLLRIDLTVVFEDFIRAALREAAHLSPEEFPDGDHCAPLRLDVKGRVRLKPDLSWHHHGTWRFVGDVKYKRDTGPGANPDLYQLHAYATATGLDDAWLIYAFGPPEARTHQVIDEGPRLHVRHIDLAASPNDILTSMSLLAAELLPTDGASTLSA
ncbi:McrC family protein [Longivirga aurantiaca]|uniref:McrC family protein n=1 Tax=Longivirga aurantiaca TaxID=1837743 RepID=A0ABW1T1Q2_9ACTN